LHAVFERADLTRPDSWAGAIDAGCRLHGGALTGHDPAALREALHQALAGVAAADLDGQGMHLGQTDPDGLPRLAELGFSLPMHAVDPAQLARILTEDGHPVGWQGGPRLEGYLRGTIDMVFHQNGRYWLADWKSNDLGKRREDYCGPALAAAMTAGAYTLQAALYTLALHRYLRQRLPGYVYERDFGAALYLFVRGARPGWRQDDGRSAGVHAVRLGRHTVDRLDALFAGYAEAAA